MKRLPQFALTVALAFSLSTGALAAEVPDSIAVEISMACKEWSRPTRSAQRRTRPR